MKLRLIYLLIVLLLALIVSSALDASAHNNNGFKIILLDSDNTIHSCQLGAFACRSKRILRVNGNLIGIDFRPADGWLYALTDTGWIYTIDVQPRGLGNTIQIGQFSPRFAGGFQSLMDWNPVANALRLIGSNDQNQALLVAPGNVQVAGGQQPIVYAQGDVNFGVDPNICGGAYTNNIAGAQTTIFYGIDYDLDTLITFPVGANGSSATGAGQAQTVGSVIDQWGNQIIFAPTADFDIYTDDRGRDAAIGVNGRSIFTIDVSQISLGQPVRAKLLATKDGSLIDIAISPGKQ